MKDLLRGLIAGQADPAKRRSMVREYLQARILLALQDHGAFADWAFLGGTALRFLYQLPRYSEDLDFSLVDPGREPRFKDRLLGVKADLEGEAYEVDIKVREERTVLMAMVKFRGILHEVGVSPHRDEVLGIKVEMDTRPPAGAGVSTMSMRRYVWLNLLHYDQASLLAGKLHAVMMRVYTKGRDLYDLAWYLSAPDWPAPNLTLLNNALVQTGWTEPPLTPETWRSVVAGRLDRVDWTKAVDDVRPFLERPQDEALINSELLRGLLAGRR